MPNRIYICSVQDGMGDLGHMIDRAGANMMLDPQFRLDNPETYCISTHSTAQKKKILDKLSALDPSHPLHINNLGSSVYITTVDDIPDEKRQIFQNAVVYKVSYITASNFSDGIQVIISNGEFSKGGGRANPEVRNMGFNDGGYGIFVKDEPIVENVDVKVLMNDLEKCENNKLLEQILGSSNYEEGIEAFKNGERALIPVYSDQFLDLNEYIRAIRDAPIMAGKHLVFLATGHIEFSEKFYPETTVIQRDYVDEKTYNIVNRLKNSNILFATGDKSLEAALNAEAVPIKSKDDGYVWAIEEMKVDEVHSEQHQEMIELLKTRDIKQRMEMLTPELMEYWHKVCIPYIKEHWNYYKVIPKMEEQGVALYKIKENPNGENIKDLWDKFSYEEKLELLKHNFGDKNPEITLSLQNTINPDVAKEIRSVYEDAEQQKEGSGKAKLMILASVQANELYKEELMMVKELDKFMQELGIPFDEFSKKYCDRFLSVRFIKAYKSDKAGIPPNYLLFSDNVKTACKEGVPFYELIEIGNVDKIEALVSEDARVAYKEGIPFAELVEVYGGDRIKALVSDNARVAYKEGVPFNELAKIWRADKIEALVSDNARAAYKEGIPFAELVEVSDGDRIKTLVSDNARVAYKEGVPFNELAKIWKVDKIEALVSDNARAEGIPFAELAKIWDADQIEALVSDNARAAYKEGIPFAESAKIWKVDKIEALVSDNARAAYKEGVPFAELAKIWKVDKIEALVSDNARAAYKEGVPFDELAKIWRADKIEALVSDNARAAYKEGVQFDELVKADSEYEISDIRNAFNADKLITATAQGDLKIVHDLGEKLGDGVSKCNKDGWNALTAATYYGNEKVVKELVEHFKMDVNGTDDNGNAAITIAALPCEEDVLKVAGEHKDVDKQA